jgi:hypothetical protein
MTATGFEIHASKGYGDSVRFEASLALARDASTKADAEAIAALFPKSLRVKGTTLWGHEHNDTGEFVSWSCGYVKFLADFRANGVQGAANETGAKRVASFLRKAAQLGYSTTWTQPYSNALTRDEFDSFLTTQN